MPLSADLRLVPETLDHDAAVAALCDTAFGPGRFVRAAERLRECAAYDRALSFAALLGHEVVGSVRQSRVRVGAAPAVLLGPLVVQPCRKGLGIGRLLMACAAEASAAAGERVILLVGDRDYYGPLGYRPLPEGAVRLPRPADPRRILALALAAGALDTLAGPVGRR